MAKAKTTSKQGKKASNEPEKGGGADKKTPQAAFISDDSEAALAHFTNEAAALSADEVEPCNGDPAIILHNAQAAFEAVAPHLPGLSGWLSPGDERMIREIPTLARALQLAAMQVTPPAASSKDIEKRLREVRPLREVALKMLEVLAHQEVKLVDPAKVAAIRAGTGPADMARDAVALRALFREAGASIEGKHPLTKEQLDKLGGDGEWLVSQIRPKGAAPAAGAGPDPKALLRDRLFTLLRRRHDGPLYLVGVKLWGRKAVDERLPGLLSHVAKAATPAPTPEG